jgi:hypothetical protein
MKEVVFIQELKEWIERLLVNAPEVQKSLADRQMQLQGEISALTAVLNKMKELAKNVDERYAKESPTTVESSNEFGVRSQGEDTQGKAQESDSGELVNPS